MTTTVTAELVICSECGTGNFRRLTPTAAAAHCNRCPATVIIATDIEPYLDGRTLTTVADRLLATIEPEPIECHECGETIAADDYRADYGRCGSCLHDAYRSGWDPTDKEVPDGIACRVCDAEGDGNHTADCSLA